MRQFVCCGRHNDCLWEKTSRIHWEKDYGNVKCFWL